MAGEPEQAPEDDLVLKTSDKLTAQDDNDKHHDASILKALGDLPLETLQYLQEKLASKDGIGNMEQLLSKLIDQNSNFVVDGSKGQQIEKEPQPSTSKQISKTEEPIDDDGHDVITIDEEDDPMDWTRAESPEAAALESFATLQSLFPDLSPTFLQAKAWDIGADREKLAQFINEALENRSSLPSRKDYVRQEEKLVAQTKIMNMSPADFIREFDEDPEKHFMNINRTASEAYTQNVLHHIRERFPHISATKFQAIKEKTNGLLVPMLREVEALPNKGRGKGKKSVMIGKPVEGPTDTDLDFLKELTYLRRETEIRDMLNNRREAIAQARADGDVFECLICFEEDCLMAERIRCDRGCEFCPRCVTKFAETQLADADNFSKFICLMKGACVGEIPLEALTSVLPPNLLRKFEEMRQQEELKAANIDNLFHCSGCNYAVIIPPDSTEKVIRCQNPECGKETCRQCGEKSHIPLSCQEVENNDEVRARTRVESAMTEAMLRECPRCRKRFVKEDHGCNSMRCPCGQAMCYVCKKPISRDHDPDHFGPGRCPLFSDTRQVHADEVLGAAAKAKENIEDGKLKNDPTKNYVRPEPREPGPFGGGGFFARLGRRLRDEAFNNPLGLPTDPIDNWEDIGDYGGERADRFDNRGRERDEDEILAREMGITDFITVEEIFRLSNEEFNVRLDRFKTQTPAMTAQQARTVRDIRRRGHFGRRRSLERGAMHQMQRARLMRLQERERYLEERRKVREERRRDLLDYERPPHVSVITGGGRHLSPSPPPLPRGRDLSPESYRGPEKRRIFTLGRRSSSPSPPPKQRKRSSSPKLDENDLYCRTCDVWVRSTDQMQAHKKGTYHLRCVGPWPDDDDKDEDRTGYDRIRQQVVMERRNILREMMRGGMDDFLHQDRAGLAGERRALFARPIEPQALPGRRSFRCELCLMEFGSVKLLREHLDDHTIVEPVEQNTQILETEQRKWRNEENKAEAKRKEDNGNDKKKEDVDIDKKPEKKYHCRICEEEFESLEALDRHVHGLRHRNRERLREFEAEENKPKKTFYCSVCDIELNSLDEMNTHVRGVKHMKREMSQRARVGEVENKDKEKKPKRTFNCTVCEIEFDTLEDLRRHSDSIDHRRTMDFLRSRPWNVPFTRPYCDVCEEWVYLSGRGGEIDLALHNEGARHRRNEERKRVEKKVGKDEGKADEEEKEEKKVFRCHLCELNLDSEESFRNHLKSVGHTRKKLKRDRIIKYQDLRGDDMFYCTVCHEEVGSEAAYLVHIEGAQHRNRKAEDEQNKEAKEEEDVIEISNSYIDDEIEDIEEDP